MLYAVEIGGKYFDVNEHDVFLYCEKEYGIEVEDFDYEELEGKINELGLSYEEFIE